LQITNKKVLQNWHLAGVTPKLLNVLLNPLEGHDLVEEGHVAGRSLVVGSQEPEGAQAVVEGHEEHAVLDDVVGAEEVGGAAAHDEGPAVDVDHDRPFLLVDVRRVDVEVEAVLGSSSHYLFSPSLMLRRLECLF
jgi:hypothetical protein